MSDTKQRAPRLVMPRRWLIAGTVVTIGAAAVPQAWAAGTEGGEGGEGGLPENIGDGVEFLTLLGLFEASHLIVAELYAKGDVAAAQEHLEASHHAHYDDLEPYLEARKAAPFEDETEAFARAVAEGAAANEVAGLAGQVMAAVAAARAGAAPADEMKAAELLVRDAAGDYEASLTDGAITAPQEYRDAWGFAEVARQRLQALSASPDAAVAGAGAAGLKAMEPVAAELPDVAATAVPGDASVLYGAAARIELAGYRLHGT